MPKHKGPFFWKDQNNNVRNLNNLRLYAHLINRYNYLIAYHTETSYKKKNVAKLCYYFDIMTIFDNPIDANLLGISQATFFRMKREVKQVKEIIKKYGEK